jgi:hypothetical protein
MSNTPTNIPINQTRHYQITVEGKIDPSWSDWFSGMTLVSRMEADGLYTTTLTGAVIDQVALRGLLNRLWDLNLVLCSIQQIDPDTLSTVD